MKAMKSALITGSAGLIGSEAVKFFIKKGFTVHGIDNNQRKVFFGEQGNTQYINKRLKDKYPSYIYHCIDIRNQKKIKALFQKNNFNLIIHTAAQPSHDWSGKYPLTDFQINAYATVILLEAMRTLNPHAIFIFTSSSKVYGDTPNHLPLKETKTRYDLSKRNKFYNGVPETMSIDNSLHSPYGAGKASADLMVQEYGKYYGLKTIVFRGNCMTGPAHAGAKLHGFLSYLTKCIMRGKKYVINGYKGKQVRDNIHSYDFVNALYHAYLHPKKGEVYNIGGGRNNSVSILEAIQMIENISGEKAYYSITDNPRKGDHIWYISDNTKFQSHYPKWKISFDIQKILQTMCNLQY